MEKRFLERRRQGWYVIVEVPPSLRSSVGKKRILKSLKTRSLITARQRRWPVVTEIKHYLETVRQADTNGDDPLAVARRLRLEPVFTGGQGAGDDDLHSLVVSDLAEQVEREHGLNKARAFYEIATGAKTELSDHMETWLSEAPLTEQTKSQHRAAVAELEAWGDEAPSIESMTRRRAGEFVSAHLLASERKPRTVNRIISSLSAYWKWMEKRGIADDNPWRGQSVPVKGRRGVAGAKERPFTNEEITSLFSGEPDRTIHDLMMIGALSAMRLDEICSLTVGDVSEGVFEVREGKTDAATRRVPIHSGLREVVHSRAKGRDGDEFLFEELKPGGRDGKRSWAISKRFTRYRRKAGVDERVEGERRSKVNFHSFRRWFITKAEEAGQSPWIIEAVVGHKRTGMTLGVYSSGPSGDQLAACVEAVHLPAIKS